VSRRPPPQPLDLDKVRTYPLRNRRSKVHTPQSARPPRPGMRMGDFFAGLPDILAAHDFRVVAHEIAARHRSGRRIVLGMGAHPIKVGLSPLIIDLMRRGILAGVAMNGAAVIHDFELAFAGETSEEVGSGLADGSFGMAEETGRFLNQAIAAARADEGLGAAVGRAVLAARCRNLDMSIVAAAARLGVPVTVHVAVGTDIIHMHPSANGAAIGAASLRDFRLLAAVVAGLHRGVFINLGSAVLIPEVFVKALNLARNVGKKVDGLVTVDMDFIRHYRPQVNVVQRPTTGSGRGYHFTGHHEIMFPLLCTAVLESSRQLAAGSRRVPGVGAPARRRLERPRRRAGKPN
jgi:deoxyhypusine synthase